MEKIDEMVADYVATRDKKKLLQDEAKKQLAPYNEKLYKLELEMLATLKLMGVKSARTDEGTAYQKTRTSVKIEDWNTVLEFIMAQKLEHMLEHRLAKSSVTEYIEANGTPPPGVSIVRDLTVGVMRS